MYYGHEINVNKTPNPSWTISKYPSHLALLSFFVCCIASILLIFILVVNSSSLQQIQVMYIKHKPREKVSVGTYFKKAKIAPSVLRLWPKAGFAWKALLPVAGIAGRGAQETQRACCFCFLCWAQPALRCPAVPICKEFCWKGCETSIAMEYWFSFFCRWAQHHLCWATRAEENRWDISSTFLFNF